jgi:hypothetical protein
MGSIPDWAIAFIGLAVGGLFTLLGYVVNGLLEQRREKVKLTHEDVWRTRDSIANTYIEGAIRPIQRDLARNLAVIGEMSSSYTDLTIQLEDTRYSEDFIRLLDEISATKLQWDKQAKAIGVARLELFGYEFAFVALAAYRAIELYHMVVRLMANDLKSELQTTKGLSKKSIEKIIDLNEEGLYQPCVNTVLRAIRDLDLLGQAIPALEMKSHFDVLGARWEDTELLAALRNWAKRDSEEFEKLEKSDGKRKKRKAGKGK